MKQTALARPIGGSRCFRPRPRSQSGIYFENTSIRDWKLTRKLPDLTAAQAEWEHSVQLQNALWTNAIAACRAVPATPPTMLLLPSLNQTFDIANTRITAARRHPPAIVYVMFAGLALVAALLAGHGLAGSKTVSRIHLIGFAAIVALTAYVTLDLEFPRFGLIRMDAADQVTHRRTKEHGLESSSLYSAARHESFLPQ